MNTEELIQLFDLLTQYKDCLPLGEEKMNAQRALGDIALELIGR